MRKVFMLSHYLQQKMEFYGKYTISYFTKKITNTYTHRAHGEYCLSFLLCITRRLFRLGSSSLSQKMGLSLIVISGMTGSLFADNCRENTVWNYRAHPLYEITTSTRVYARGEIIKVLRKDIPGKEGLVKVVLFSGEHRKKITYATTRQPAGGNTFKKIEGAKVVLSYFEGTEPVDVLIEGCDKSGAMVILIVIFIGLTFLIGKNKIVFPLLALIVNFLIIKLCFIPAIISGEPLVTYIYIVIPIMVILTVISITGVNRRAVFAILGSLIALTVVIFMGFIVYSKANIAGYFIPEIRLISSIFKGRELSFYRDFMLIILVIIASGIITSTGIITASLNYNKKDEDFKSFFSGRMVFSRNAVSIMLNVVFMAQLGVFFAVIVIESLEIKSFLQVINMDAIYVICSQVFICGIGCLVCMVVTAFIAAIGLSGWVDKGWSSITIAVSRIKLNNTRRKL